MTTPADIIDNLIRREGDEYTNRKSDRGGPTKYGVTLKTLQRWRSQPVTADDVRNLTEAEARAIYLREYVEPFDLLHDPSLRALLVDCAVQHGADDAVRWLQLACGFKGRQVDGKLGPITAAAANSRPLRQVFAEVLAMRCSYYGELVTDDPRRVAAQIAGFRLQAENAHGWANRLAEFIRETAVL